MGSTGSGNTGTAISNNYTVHRVCVHDTKRLRKATSKSATRRRCNMCVGHSFAPPFHVTGGVGGIESAPVAMVTEHSLALINTLRPAICKT